MVELSKLRTSLSSVQETNEKLKEEAEVAARDLNTAHGTITSLTLA